MMKRWLAVLLITCCAGFPARAQESAPARPLIETFTLANGLEVIVIPIHRVPAVSHTLWFRVGAADDPPRKSGLAHYHEHLMFQGTEHYAAGEYADIIARHGGQQNAFTNHDATGYYVNIAREHLPLIMNLEADRLRSLAPSPENARKEREVIIEERRERIDNDPQALLFEQVMAALYLHYPYRIPTIGWKHEMEGLTREDVMELHRTHYHPGNAVLIVSGDITAEAFRPLAEEHYGRIPAGPTPERMRVSEPPHLAARRIAMTHANVTHPVWMRSYLAPGLRTGEMQHALPLFVLEHLLGGGRTSRLHQSLVVRQKLATLVSADYNGLRIGPAAFTISAVPAGETSLKTLEDAIDRELEALMREGVRKDELARAKTLLKADTLYAREGLQSMGYILGWIRVIGLPVEFFLEWPEKIDGVTAAQVQEAARAVLQMRHSVTGTLMPEKSSAPAPKGKTKGTAHVP